MRTPLLALSVASLACSASTTPADTTKPVETASCASPKAGWIWCDDFESDRSAQYFEVSTDNGSLARVAGVGRNGTAGMRTHFNSGQVSAGSMKLAFGRVPSTSFKPVDGGTTDYREIYWRVFLRHQTGWTGGGGYKLTRAMILAAADWSQAMIAHVWTDGRANDFYLLLDPASGTNEAGTLQTSGYNDFAHLRWLGLTAGTTPIFDAAHVGQWYCIEAHVKLNTAGQSDGVFEYWVDGQLNARKTGMNWVGSYSQYGINAVFLESYWNSGSLAAQDRFWDDFVVSVNPIGC